MERIRADQIRAGDTISFDKESAGEVILVDEVKKQTYFNPDKAIVAVFYYKGEERTYCTATGNFPVKLISRRCPFSEEAFSCKNAAIKSGSYTDTCGCCEKYKKWWDKNGSGIDQLRDSI